MTDPVAAHYSSRGGLVDTIAESLQKAGKELSKLQSADLAPVDEFHIRGRKATLELAERMNLNPASRVLDLGSGLGGPARTLAETYGCHVTGVDLTQAFCDAAEVISDWVNLGERVVFQQGDVTDLPFADRQFDAAMTIHVAMNIPAKDKMYEHARRVLNPGGIFVVYDVLEGEGGEVLFPVPWARDHSISHLATRDEMELLLVNAGFRILEIQDSTSESQRWFIQMAMAGQSANSGQPPLTFQVFLGNEFPEMARNQVQNLTDRRIRTVSFVCQA